MAISSAPASMMLHFAIYSLIMAGIPALSPAKNMASAKAPGRITASGGQAGMKVAAAASIAVQLGDSWPRPTAIEEAAIKALEQHLPTGGRGLCVGCEAGSITSYMAAEMASRVGVCGSVKATQVESAIALEARSDFEQRLPSSLQGVLQVVQGDAAYLAQEGKLGPDFDAIFIGDEMKNVPQALCKSIKPGGAIVVAVAKPSPQLVLIQKPISSSLHSSLTHQVIWGSSEQDHGKSEAELARGNSGLADLVKQTHASSIPDLERDWNGQNVSEEDEAEDSNEISMKKNLLERDSVEGEEEAGGWDEEKEDGSDQEIVRRALNHRKDDFWRDCFWHDVVWREDGTLGYDASKDEDSSLGDEPPWQRPIWTAVMDSHDDALARLCSKRKTIKAGDVYRARKKGLKTLRSRAGCAIIGKDVKLLPLSKVHIDNIALFLNTPEARRSVVGHEITRGILDSDWYQSWGDRVFSSMRECWLTVMSNEGSQQVLGLVALRFGPKYSMDPTIARIAVIIDGKRRMEGKATQALALTINFAFHHLGARKFVACFETGDEGCTILFEKLSFTRRNGNDDIDPSAAMKKSGGNCGLVDEWWLSATEEWVDSIVENVPSSKKIV